MRNKKFHQIFRNTSLKSQPGSVVFQSQNASFRPKLYLFLSLRTLGKIYTLSVCKSPRTE